jgi:hypothetical protein
LTVAYVISTGLAAFYSSVDNGSWRMAKFIVANPTTAWSIQQKTAWTKQQNLLGAMVWETSGDTSAGSGL